MLEAEVPLLRVRVLEVVVAEVQLVDRQELVQVAALSGENGEYCAPATSLPRGTVIGAKVVGKPSPPGTAV